MEGRVVKVLNANEISFEDYETQNVFDVYLVGYSGKSLKEERQMWLENLLLTLTTEDDLQFDASMLLNIEEVNSIISMNPKKLRLEMMNNTGYLYDTNGNSVNDCMALHLNMWRNA